MDRRLSPEQRREAAWVARRAELMPLDHADLDALAGHLQRREFRRGEVLVRSDEVPPGVWIVRGGVVELAVGPRRRRSVVKLLRDGDVEGDVAIVLGQRTAHEARAVTDGSALHLDRRSFDQLLTDHPVIARRWLANCMQRLRQSDRRIVQLLGTSVQEQVARLLLDEAVDGAVSLPQETLAAMLGVRRQSLNKALKELELMGVVRLAYARVQVRDVYRLGHLAGQSRH